MLGAGQGSTKRYMNLRKKLAIRNQATAVTRTGFQCNVRGRWHTEASNS